MADGSGRKTRVTSSHWGAFEVDVEDDRIVATRPFARSAATTAPARSIWLNVHPPKIAPDGLASRGIAIVRRCGPSTGVGMAGAGVAEAGGAGGAGASVIAGCTDEARPGFRRRSGLRAEPRGFAACRPERGAGPRNRGKR